MSYGSGPFGSSPYGGGSSLFQVLGATAVNPFTVIITFSDAPDLSVPGTASPASYNFGIGGITAIRVLPDTDPNSVRVITTEQQYQLYTVTVAGSVESSGGATVDPQADTAEFTGFPSAPRFIARAQSATTVNIVFLQPMLADLALSNPANYAIQDMDGTPVSILAATPNDVVTPTRVALKTSALVSGVPYVLSITPSVKASDGRIIQPNDAIITWHRTANRASVPLSSFTGEVKARRGQLETLRETLQLEESLSVVLDPLLGRPEDPEALHEVLVLQEYLQVSGSGLDTSKRLAVQVSEPLKLTEKSAITNLPDGRSTKEVSLAESLSIRESLEVLPELPHGLDPKIRDLFGNPDGLVFFSPSLISGGAPTSSIQVDEVKACTIAYDSYVFPKPIDPKPLYTHGGGITPTPEVTTLNNGVLFTDFYRLGEAKHKLKNKPQDALPVPNDIGASIVMKQVYPPNRVALLNNPAWILFNNGAPPPYSFITMDNLSPLPPPTVLPTQHYVNPSEVLQLTEGLQTAMATSVTVSDTLTQSENFDLVPGENVVQVNVAESMAITEALETQIGVNLFETLTLTEAVTAL